MKARLERQITQYEEDLQTLQKQAQYVTQQTLKTVGALELCRQLLKETEEGMKDESSTES